MCPAGQARRLRLVNDSEKFMKRRLLNFDEETFPPFLVPPESGFAAILRKLMRT